MVHPLFPITINHCVVLMADLECSLPGLDVEFWGHQKHLSLIIRRDQSRHFEKLFSIYSLYVFSNFDETEITVEASSIYCLSKALYSFYLSIRTLRALYRSCQYCYASSKNLCANAGRSESPVTS